MALNFHELTWYASLGLVYYENQIHIRSTCKVFSPHEQKQCGLVKFWENGSLFHNAGTHVCTFFPHECVQHVISSLLFEKISGHIVYIQKVSYCHVLTTYVSVQDIFYERDVIVINSAKI